jgi:hypothetical protein
MNQRIASKVARVPNLIVLAGLVGAGLSGSISVPSSVSDTLAQRQHGGPVTETAQAAVAAITSAARDVGSAPMVVADAAASTFKFKVDSQYDKLRAKVRWLPVRLGDSELKTPDAQSRLLLAQSAAQRANLQQVGLSYRDVYGIINAETSWIPRMGASKDGTPNLGIAQFEPATAKAMGIVNPADPVEAVHAAALHMRDAAVWSARRISGLKLSPDQQARKLREGVSIYYNLSTKGRNTWNGRNTAKLPVETRRHIANARLGAREAAELEQELAELKGRMNQGGMMTASYSTPKGR